MVSAYVFVNAEPGKNAQVVKKLRAIAGVKQAHIYWGCRTSSRSSRRRTRRPCPGW